MRWITFLILLYIMAALQVSHLFAFPDGGHAFWPSILFLPDLAIFYALFAAEPAAPLCGLICGIAFDLANAELIGTNAVALALVAFIVMKIRLSIFRDHAVSQALITLLALLLFTLLNAIFRLILGAPLDGHSFWIHIGHLAADSVYSAIVAPILFWLFFRFTPLLGFTKQGPRSRSHI